jgi:high-affinity Fe2+/Pb2+ permease
MPDEPNIKRGGRDTLLTVTLVVFVGGLLIFFLNLISLGVFTYVLGAVVVFAVVGFLHYVLWGYAMSQDVADERAAMMRDEERETGPAQDGIQDLSRRRRRRT